MFKCVTRTVLLVAGLMSTSCWAALNQAEAMNTAGFQRTLGQRVAKDYFMIGADVRTKAANEQLADTLALFESNQKALTAVAPTPEIKSLLADIDTRWAQYKALVKATPSRQSAPAVLNAADQLLAQCQKLTDLMQQHYGDESSRLVNRSGWERTMTQRIAALYVAKSWKVDAPGLDASLDKAIKDFDSTLDELNQGKQENPQIAESLRKANAQWSFAKKGFDITTASNYVPTAVTISTDSLLKQMNELTRLYAGLAAR